MDVFGLPLHPLVVHAAVVLVPLAALGALLVVAVPRLRPHHGLLAVGLAAAAAAAALAARFSGEWFLDATGLRASGRMAAHAAWGMWTPWPALLLAVALPLFLWAARRPDDRPGGGAAVVVAGALTVAGALASLVLVALTGHSGAAAVWG